MIELFDSEKFILTDEEIKYNDLISDGYFVWQWKDDSSLLGRKKAYRIETTIEFQDCIDFNDKIYVKKYTENDMQEYAEFCVICYSQGLPCIIPKDWFNQYKK